ncbi:uncharacterized protein PV09_01870 [Verruconis gallopava]|uniref:Major facilitator superfamily (MFS) profile domain-containing protein n=1 Tax=Verruconis gallopava TaxID=253628 RepID=A0A0D1XYX2_9PEZI|nr:uncharacterized protein PV09_01870 [Verruconis gallopava]KIW07971.1 hypothetical protein PV09_01870 [Verruconis gallopava]
MNADICQTIAEDFSATSVSTYWAGAAFVLCSAVVQPIFASLSLVHEQYTVLTALTSFTVGSLVAALAKDIAVLIAGRCIQGIGGGGLMVTTWVVLARLFNLEQRSRYYSLVGLVWTVCTILGPLIGGGFALVSWRWIFWINLPLAAICYVLIILFLKFDNKSEKSLMARLGAVDWTGNIVFAVSIALILLAISWGGVLHPWRSAGTLLPLLLGILCLSAWFIYSYKYCKSPMIPAVVLSDRTAAVSFGGTFILGLCQFCLIYYLPLYYEGVKGYSTFIVGVALLPQLVGAGPSTIITSLLIAKTHLTRPFSILGWLLFVYGALELTLLEQSTSVYHWIVLNIPSGLGIGILFSSLSMSTQASAENRANCTAEERQRVKSMAASLNPFFRVLGQACGIVVAQAAFTNQVAKELGAEAAKDAVLLVKRLRGMPANTQETTRILQSFVSGLRTIWWVVVALTGVMFVLTLFSRDYSLTVEERPRQEIVEDEKKRMTSDVEHASTASL